MSDCCREKCSDEHVQRNYCSRNPGHSVEESPQEEDDLLMFPDSPAYQFHFGTLNPRMAAELAEEAPPTSTPKAVVTRSKLIIGRVPQDYVNSWTYTG